MAIVLNGQTNDVTIDGVSVATESEAVLKTGNETIAGVKTFSSSPIVPNATTATQAMAYGQGVNLTAAQTIAGVKIFSDNVGIGVTPSAWLPSKRAIELPSTAISDNGLGGIIIGSNGYTNTSGQDIYRFNGYASTIVQYEGITYFSTALSGLAGNPITWKTALTIDVNANVLVTGSGGLGYGTGSGGTVTQLTSKSAAVTLNKPCGQIVTNSASLAAGSAAGFLVYNSVLGPYDTIIVSPYYGLVATGNYKIYCVYVGGSGYFAIHVQNISGGALAEAVVINFAIIKGSIN